MDNVDNFVEKSGNNVMVTLNLKKNVEKCRVAENNKNYYVNKRNPHLKVEVFNNPNVDNVDKLF